MSLFFISHGWIPSGQTSYFAQSHLGDKTIKGKQKEEKNTTKRQNNVTYYRREGVGKRMWHMEEGSEWMAKFYFLTWVVFTLKFIKPYI